MKRVEETLDVKQVLSVIEKYSTNGARRNDLWAILSPLYLHRASAPSIPDGASATKAFWVYVGETVFSMPVPVGAIKISHRVCKEMIG